MSTLKKLGNSIAGCTIGFLGAYTTMYFSEFTRMSALAMGIAFGMWIGMWILLMIWIVEWSSSRVVFER